jgi:hypothetical protein
MRHRRNSTVERSWEAANEIAQDEKIPRFSRRNAPKRRTLSSGRWELKTILSFTGCVVETGQAVLETNARVLKHAASHTGNIVSNVIGKSTYAVVTFTSRQAAIAARQCLADSSGGVNRWIEIEDIPVPPLADAPAWNIWACRGVCRPVTFTINDHEKRLRNNWYVQRPSPDR